MTIERNRHREISFCCDTQGCREFIDTNTDDFSDALIMLRAERWTALATVDKRHVRTWEHFCQQCSDEIARIKEDAVDGLLKGVPKRC